jgi:transcriptional regulator with XRE-family HTH domain
MKMLFTYLPEEIKRLREEAGYTRTRLARMARINPHSVFRLETGKNQQAESRVLEGVARALGVPVDRIAPDYYPPLPSVDQEVSFDRDRFKARRLELGLSRQQIADRAETNYHLVWEIERQQGRKVKPSNVYKLAHAVGLKPGDLAPSLRYGPDFGERELWEAAGMPLTYPEES